MLVILSVLLHCDSYYQHCNIVVINLCCCGCSVAAFIAVYCCQFICCFFKKSWHCCGGCLHYCQCWPTDVSDC